MIKLSFILSLAFCIAIISLSCSSEETVDLLDNEVINSDNNTTGDIDNINKNDNVVNDTASAPDNPEDSDILAEESPDLDSSIIVQCTPGEKKDCYTGPSGTKDVGICKSGYSTCNFDGTGWSNCDGMVTPLPEICSDGLDQNCDGEDATPENTIDLDGDGYTYCNGDCCELKSECADPAKVNSGGFEVPANMVDDNCNGEIDEVTSCDTGVSVSADTSSSALALAKAAGMCSPWLISATLGLAGTPVSEYICDGDQPPSGCTKSDRMSKPNPYYDGSYKTYAVNPKFGEVIVKKEGDNLCILSTGDWDNPTMSAEDAILGDGDMKTASTVPEDWINRQANCESPKAPACGGTAPDPNIQNSCAGKPQFTVQDPIMLTAKLKVPTNAVAFRINTYFCSIEYPQTVCSDAKYNDFFITLLDSTYNEKNPASTNLNPYDKNLAKDDKDNPLGVDIAPAGLFKVCNTNCKGLGYDTNKWGLCTGDQELAGTGFGSTYMNGKCMGGHGCTGWLNTQGNVVPGEEITIRFALFEQGTVLYGPDHSYDSTVLLDNFQWLTSETKPGTGIQN